MASTPASPAPDRPGRWERALGNSFGIPEAIAGFAVGLLLSAVAGELAANIDGWNGHGSVPLAVTVPDLIGLWVGLVGAVLFMSRRRGNGHLGADFGLRLGSPLDVVIGAAVGFGCQYLLIPALYWPFEQIWPHLAHQLSGPAGKETGAVHSLPAAIVLSVFLVIGAPVVEELFFRGMLLRGLLARLPVPISVVACGLAFGLAHFEALQFAGLALFGVVLSLLAWASGRLAPSISAHAAFNLAAVIAVVHLR